MGQFESVEKWNLYIVKKLNVTGFYFMPIIFLFLTFFGNGFSSFDGYELWISAEIIELENRKGKYFRAIHLIVQHR